MSEKKTFKRLTTAGIEWQGWCVFYTIPKIVNCVKQCLSDLLQAYLLACSCLHAVTLLRALNSTHARKHVHTHTNCTNYIIHSLLLASTNGKLNRCRQVRRGWDGKLENIFLPQNLWRNERKWAERRQAEHNLA